MLKSIWLTFPDETDFPKLKNNLTVDVAIVGGGITGITAAQLLVEKGMKVAVFEKFRVGGSSTGNSTGNLYAAVSEILLDVRKKFGDDVMEMVINSRKEAIDIIEKNINEYNIDCDFRRVSWNYYSTISQCNHKIQKAFDAARKTGYKVYYSDLPETRLPVKKGMTVESSAAQFNPLRYVQGLAKRIHSDDCRIYECTEVTEFHETNAGVSLKTNDGYEIKAKYVIHATHSPKGIMTFHAQMGPYREYGVACKIKGSFPDGVYFGYFDPTDITSVRTYERDGEQYLVVVGEPHKVGHDDSQYHLDRLERFARDHFFVTEVTHHWGAQNYKASDYLPYIGPKRSDSPVYIATGLSSHGLTYGTVAAMIISDQITGHENAYSEIYRPDRFHPVKSAPKFIKENIDVMKSIVKDYFFTKNREPLVDVKIGEGKVIDEEGHKLAVFRDENEGLHVCSAVCSHMGCIVRWNTAEKSWDCPCHGSRFSTDGDVLEGPAIKALKSLSELIEEKGEHVAFGNNVSGVTPDLLNEPINKDQHVMSVDEMLDEANIESFPASDPPGHISVSKIDKDQHTRNFSAES